MPATLHILGIRHHGPGSARMVLRTLEVLKPDAVLIEGPPDAAEVLALAADEAMRPPVALLVYDPDEPSDAAYYPFALFSPEWQAIRWGLQHGSEVRFIDLPRAMRPSRAEAVAPPIDPATPPTEGKVDAATGNTPLAVDPAATTDPDDDTNADADSEPDHDVDEVSSNQPHELHTDPLDALAHAAGYIDGEAWWGRLIEERNGQEDPLGVFSMIREAMSAARTARAETPRARIDPDEPAREAHMRKSIRAAIKQGFSNVVVICGAWHAPVLTEDALKAHAAKADDDLLKGLTKHKTAATWIPWTYDRLSMYSGYGAGVASPGWYDHLWLHQEHVTGRWMTRVARLMRQEDLDASPASVIEAVRLAETIASLRGRSVAGLDEMSEATLAVLCHGNPLPMRVIERKLIVGQQLGSVPESAPSVPLQRDIAAQQKTLRMKLSADDTELDLDQRKETDLARSRLLHRLAILNIPWGTRVNTGRRQTSTFHEVWKLQWKPEFAVAIIEAACYGNTVAAAAAGCVNQRAAAASDLPALTAMLDNVMLADLPGAVEQLVDRIAAVSAVSTDVGHLMDALPSLTDILRYGDVRKTDAALVQPLVSGLVSRVCAGLIPACGSLDDDAAAKMRTRIDQVQAALITLDQPALIDPWSEQLARLGDTDLHGLITGRCWRHLLDTSKTDADHAASRLALALSPGNDPAKASAWLEGFLAGSGMVLVHDPRLLAIVDQWVASLPTDIFEQVCPIARRTFSSFESPERRQIGERLKKGFATSPTGSPASNSVAADNIDPQRAALVDPVLRLIFGEAPQ